MVKARVKQVLAPEGLYPAELFHPRSLTTRQPKPARVKTQNLDSIWEKTSLQALFGVVSCPAKLVNTVA
jgi:hypothetical protein